MAVQTANNCGRRANATLRRSRLIGLRLCDVNFALVTADRHQLWRTR